MAYKTAPIPAENLDNISEEQMLAFAEQFNALEPSSSNMANNVVLGTDLAQMLDFMDVISIFGVIAAVTYLSLPYLRKLPAKLALIRS